jgi:hypothetical protein
MARESDCYAVSATLLNIGTGGSLFVALTPIMGQVGVQIFIKGTGGTLEIAGGGYSSAALGSSFVLMGSSPATGNVPKLVANGSGYPIVAATASNSALSFTGAPCIWFSSGGVTTTLAVLYLLDEQRGTYP